ncbi:phosphoribosyltransferase family protein [Pseudonocardia cypriaca]|uniref:Orotate phosphoribosyltransferase n=1 Tax=Pseudonocardia cypriaca TaxID=882449 RepID=A0A543FRC9_9PSEU|nr:phosphoribosyltransferase family protein [Pseudonocardia cypriaca]TQM36341.1 orotate phosphoribosyltransferase [Pseudonocardia cypriaca]
MRDPLDLQDGVLAMMSARTGHFPLESGHHGELWLELDALFWTPAALEPFAHRLAELIRPHEPDVVCGPLVGGAFLAQLVAARLGVRFCHTERTSTGDGLYAATYRLPDALTARLAGLRVAVVDDVVNAGSAVRATLAALGQADARPVALGALLALGSTPAAVAASAGLPLESVATRDNEIWEPEHCPRCANGEALQTP